MTAETLDKLKKFSSDLDLFLTTHETQDVVLSDGAIIPSYRKFAKEKSLKNARKWNADYTYDAGDVVSDNEKLYLALKNTREPLSNRTDWRFIVNASGMQGTGLSAFCSYDTLTNEITTSRNILSVVRPSTDEIHIIVDNAIRAGANKKLMWAFSYESIYMDENLANIPNENQPSSFYSIYGRCFYNNDNTIKILLNLSIAKHQPILNFIFVKTED